MLAASLALLLGTNNAPSSRSKVRHTHGHTTESPQRVHRGWRWSVKLHSLKRKGSKRAAGPRHGLVDVAGAPLLAVEADLLRRVLLLRTARRSAGHTQAHEGALETAFVRARGDARGDARTQAQASSSAAASSSSTAAPHQHGVPSLALSDVVAAGRAALAGAAAEVQACVPQPWSYAYIRRAALVHSHSTGNPRKGAHRRRPRE